MRCARCRDFIKENEKWQPRGDLCQQCTYDAAREREAQHEEDRRKDAIAACLDSIFPKLKFFGHDIAGGMNEVTERPQTERKEALLELIRLMTGKE